VYHNLKSVIKKKYGQDACNVGDEGGFAPNILENKEGLDLLQEAIEKAGYTGKVKIGMDVAASEFWLADKSTYDLDFKTEGNDGSQCKSGPELQALYEEFCKDYPMVSIEDPFDQDDFDSYKKMTESVGTTCQIVGDDLLVTNPKRVQKAIDEGACNALLLKVNQIGSVTEAIEAVNMAKKAGWGVMTSHRSGETEDSFIAGTLRVPPQHACAAKPARASVSCVVHASRAILSSTGWDGLRPAVRGRGSGALALALSLCF